MRTKNLRKVYPATYPKEKAISFESLSILLHGWLWANCHACSCVSFGHKMAFSTLVSIYELKQKINPQTESSCWRWTSRNIHRWYSMITVHWWLCIISHHLTLIRHVCHWFSVDPASSLNISGKQLHKNHKELSCFFILDGVQLAMKLSLAMFFVDWREWYDCISATY